MKLNLKSFFAGILVTSLVGTGTIAFAESSQTIQAIFGRVKLVVADKPVEQETLLYNGTTYVPLRAAAEILGKEVAWDGATNTAYIKEKQSEAAPKTAENNTQQGLMPVEPKKEEKEVTVKKKELPFRLGEIDYELEILPPNSIGTVYMRTRIANRTKYTITRFSITWFDSREGRERFLSSSQYVKPNFVSDYFESFGPKTGNSEDIELWETRVTFLNDEGKDTTLTYDHRTETYSVSGTW